MGRSERARITRKAFEVRAKLRDGRPVGEDERALLLRYDSDPDRPRKTRHLYSPDPDPIPESPVVPSTEPGGTGPEPAPEAAAPIEPSDPLPPLSVGKEVQDPEPPRVRLSRAEAETAGRVVYEKIRARNQKNEEEGKFALPEEFLDLVVYPCTVGCIERRGGIRLSPKQEDAVVAGTIGVVLASGYLGKGKPKADPAPSSPTPTPPPSSPTPTPAEQPADLADSPV